MDDPNFQAESGDITQTENPSQQQEDGICVVALTVLECQPQSPV